jgi:hypothetical protein
MSPLTGRPDRPGAGPTLSRPIDRIEAMVGWAVTAVTMILLVLAALAGTATYVAEAGHDQSAVAARTSSTAARPGSGSSGSDQRGSDQRVSDQPTHPSVTPRTGLVLTGSGSPAGLGVGIWLDQYGRTVAPPRDSGRAVLAGATSAGQVLIVGGAVLLLLRGAARRAITAANLRNWEREWARVGPDWDRRIRE